jgi:AAA ATPase domain
MNKIMPFADEPLLVGRDHELAIFRKILEVKQAQLVVLTGQAGMGKSSLLQKFHQLGEEAGWNVLDLPESSSINGETTPDSFSMQLQTLLAAPTAKTFIEKPNSPLVDRATGEPLLPIVERFLALAPLLLTVDGFRPRIAFAEWFQTVFVNHLKRSGAPIVLIISERPKGATKITAWADQIIQLGPLDAYFISEHFKDLGRQISPPMSAKEIQEYTKAAQNDTEILDNLTRVLRLALPSPMQSTDMS